MLMRVLERGPTSPQRSWGMLEMLNNFLTASKPTIGHLDVSYSSWNLCPGSACLALARITDYGVSLKIKQMKKNFCDLESYSMCFCPNLLAGTSGCAEAV